MDILNLHKIQVVLSINLMFKSIVNLMINLLKLLY